MPECSECGGELLHNRKKGALELDFAELVFECSDCENTDTVLIDPVEEEEKAEKWDEALERMTYGRAQSEDSTVSDKAEIELKQVNQDPAEHEDQVSLNEVGSP